MDINWPEDITIPILKWILTILFLINNNTISCIHKCRLCFQIPSPPCDLQYYLENDGNKYQERSVKCRVNKKKWYIQKINHNKFQTIILLVITGYTSTVSIVRVLWVYSFMFANQKQVVIVKKTHNVIMMWDVYKH